MSWSSGKAILAGAWNFSVFVGHTITRKPLGSCFFKAFLSNLSYISKLLKQAVFMQMREQLENNSERVSIFSVIAHLDTQ